MMVPVHFFLVGFVLLETLNVFLCRAEFALTTDDHDVIMTMCQAQYTAWCSNIHINCTSTSHLQEKFNNSTWLFNCTGPDTNQTDAECEGTCSNFLATEKGYVPVQPDVRVSRVPLMQVIEISWNADPQSTSEVIYVIASNEPNVTDRPGVIQLSKAVNITYQMRVSDSCWTPEFRVAAVSRYGSRWFSHSVDVPDLILGPPQDITLTTLNYDPAVNSEFIYYTLEWRPPVGWSSLDLKLEHKVNYATDCVRRSFFDALYVFVDTFKRFHVLEPSTAAVQGSFSLTGRIPVDAIGCNITFSIQAVSNCNSGLVGSAGKYTFNLDCEKVPKYSGGNCEDFLVVFPGQVKDIRFVIVPKAEGFVGLVSWLPPDSLGSFRRLETYKVFWGIMDLMNSDPITSFTSLLGNATIPGTELETDLDLNVTWLHPEETVGVMVSAAGLGQVIDMPYSDIYLPLNGVTSATKPGTMITDDHTIIVVECDADETNEADIFWRRTQVHDQHNQAVSYDIQWGFLSCGDNNTDEKYDFTRVNTTRVHQAYITLQGLLENTTYGIKIVPVFNVSSDVLDEQGDDWNRTELHSFTMSPGQVTRRVKSTPPLSHKPANATDQPGLDTIHVIAVAISGVLASVGALLVGVRMRRRHQRPGMIGVVGVTDTEYRDYTVFSPGASTDPSRVTHCPVVADEWELPLSCVKFGHVLGSGAFGKVVKGKVTRAMLTHRGVAPLLVDGGACFDDVSKLHVTVAIKMLQEDCDSKYKQDFLKEIQLMKTLGHHQNVVSMLGCCTLREPICLIVEHAEFGDLLNYLKEVRHQVLSIASADSDYVNRGTDIVSARDLLMFARQVAQGMEFLASKGFVHRDLAARNVLMCANRTCKIGDFGLARYIYDNIVYVNRRGGRLPVKWMSVEAIFDMSFSMASDVWSFGILLYEIVTLGGTPYPTIPTRELLRELQGGYRMEKPGTCSNTMYQMMMQCWQTNTNDRPTFCLLSQWLQAMIEDISETDHLDMKLSLDRNLYKTDEETALCVEEDLALTADQGSINSSDSSEYCPVLMNHDQGASIVCYKSVSEDSGYSSPQKESVSSGGSTMTFPAGTVASDNRSWTEATPREESSRNFPETFSETVVDDVFHEDGVVGGNERNQVFEIKRQKEVTISLRIPHGVCGRQQVLAPRCTYNPEAVREKTEDRNISVSHQSLPNLSDKALSAPFANHSNLPRRTSDSDIIITSKKMKVQSQLHTAMMHNKTTSIKEMMHNKTTSIKEMIHHKMTPTNEMIPQKTTSETMETPRRTTNTAGNRQRRKAVVIPPTLALDNELYHAGGETLRQNPPVVCISRRKPPNRVSEIISADTWTGDGEFNFRRAGGKEWQTERTVCLSMTHETEVSPLDTDNPVNPNRKNSTCIVQVQVHRDCPFDEEEKVAADRKREALSCTNSLALHGSETRQGETEVLPDQPRLSPRTHRTFVRSNCRSISKDTTWWKSASDTRNQFKHENHQWPTHVYADFNNIVKQSNSPNELSGMNREETRLHTTSFESQLFDLKAANHPSTCDNHRELEHNHPEADILHASASGSQSCKSPSLCMNVLDTLSQVVRRTYSSPKEHTLTQTDMCGEDVHHTDSVSFLSRRRLSDPFVVPVSTILGHLPKCQLSAFPLNSQYPSSNSPGQQATCFQWPYTRRRKHAGADRSICSLDTSARKLFPHEKHPAALHYVFNPDNV